MRVEGVFRCISEQISVVCVFLKVNLASLQEGAFTIADWKHCSGLHLTDVHNKQISVASSLWLPTIHVLETTQKREHLLSEVFFLKLKLLKKESRHTLWWHILIIDIGFFFLSFFFLSEWCCFCSFMSCRTKGIAWDLGLCSSWLLLIFSEDNNTWDHFLKLIKASKN